MSRESLPSELKDAIAAFCSAEDLFLLALTNREFQIYAESRLYRHLTVETYDGSGVAALQSIAGNQTKARYVKLLSVEFDTNKEHRGEDIVVMGNVVRVIPAICNIEKLRIRLVREDLFDCASSLNDVLCAKLFPRLSHLFVEDQLDFQRIAGAQVQLEVFGIFLLRTSGCMRLDPIAQHLNGRSLCVLGLGERGMYQSDHPHIELYPTLLDPKHAQDLLYIFEESQEVVNSRWGTMLDWEGVETVTIVIETSPRLDVLEELMLWVNSLPLLEQVSFHVKPGLLQSWKWKPTQEVARKYMVCNWNGVGEGYWKVVFRGCEHEFIKYIATY